MVLRRRPEQGARKRRPPELLSSDLFYFRESLLPEGLKVAHESDSIG